MRLTILALALAIALGSSDVLDAQRITVAVAIDDSLANRAFSGAFAAAFRNLGDVDVVTASESPEYVIEGVVMCEPRSCQNPLSYSASLRFWSPIQEYTATLIAFRTVSKSPARTYRQRLDSVATNAIWPLLNGYEMTHTTWVAVWGRDRYEQRIRELVRQIDTECFERNRAYSRAFSADSVTSSRILRMIDERSWMC